MFAPSPFKRADETSPIQPRPAPDKTPGPETCPSNEPLRDCSRGVPPVHRWPYRRNTHIRRNRFLFF